MSDQHTYMPWLMCNPAAHVWIHGFVGDPPDGLPCACGQTTWAAQKRKVQEVESGHGSYAFRTTPQMHPALAWLLLTLLLVALVLAGSAS